MQRQFPVEGVSKEKQRTIEQLVERVVRLYSLTAHPLEREATRKSIEVLRLKNLPADSKRTVASVVLIPASAVEVSPYKSVTVNTLDKDELTYRHYTSFIPRICGKLRKKSDFEKVAKFYKNLEEFSWHIKTLVSVLRKMYEAGYARQHNITITVQALKMLQHLVNNAEGDEQREEMQKKLAAAGVAGLFIELCSSPVHEIVSEALNLGISLLDPGNRLVQSSIYFVFTSKASNANNFFTAIRKRIRTGIE